MEKDSLNLLIGGRDKGVASLILIIRLLGSATILNNPQEIGLKMVDSKTKGGSHG